jgi:hypothetical protein
VKGIGDWCGFLPEELQTETVEIPSRRALLITPAIGGPFVMDLEWDDGNGMWISTGVSRDFSTT